MFISLENLKKKASKLHNIIHDKMAFMEDKALYLLTQFDEKAQESLSYHCRILQLNSFIVQQTKYPFLP